MKMEFMEAKGTAQEMSNLNSVIIEILLHFKFDIWYVNDTEIQKLKGRVKNTFQKMSNVLMDYK